MSEPANLPPAPRSISDVDSAGNKVTWVAVDGLAAAEAHRRMLELLFAPRLRG